MQAFYDIFTIIFHLHFPTIHICALPSENLRLRPPKKAFKTKREKNETEMQKFLSLTVKDVVSLVENNLTQNAISVLDSISYFEVIDYLTR